MWKRTTLLLVTVCQQLLTPTPNYGQLFVDFSKACPSSKGKKYNLTLQRWETYKRRYTQLAPDLVDGRVPQSYRCLLLRKANGKDVSCTNQQHSAINQSFYELLCNADRATIWPEKSKGSVWERHSQSAVTSWRGSHKDQSWVLCFSQYNWGERSEPPYDAEAALPSWYM